MILLSPAEPKFAGSKDGTARPKETVPLDLKAPRKGSPVDLHANLRRHTLRTRPAGSLTGVSPGPSLSRSISLPVPAVSLRRLLVAALPLLCALSACQDPSGVGLGLIDEDGGSPNARIFEADSVRLTFSEASTSGFAVSGSPVQSRALLGAVQDSRFGNASATTYLDARRSTLPDDFDEVVGVELRLARSVIYGDTLASLPVDVREVTATWSPIELPIDTTFATGSPITTTSISAEDSLVTIPFPESWVTDNAERLLSEDFDETFEGFELRPSGDFTPSPGAVLGFNVAQSRLRLIGEEDTVDYRFNEVHSAVSRQEPSAPPANTLSLRDATTSALAFRLALDALENRAVANAALRLSVARDAVEPEGTFVRPLLPSVALVAIQENGEELFVGEISISGENETLSLTSGTLTALIQQIAIDATAPIERFELLVPSNPTSLSVLPLQQGGSVIPIQLSTVLIDEDGGG